MTRQCYLLNYTLDYEEENATLNSQDRILTVTSTDIVPQNCKDVIRSLTCAAVYPGCNPDNDLPQGLCEDECVEYVIAGECAKPILNSAQLAAASGNPVSFSFLECNTPLGFVEEHDASFINSSLDIENCINISSKFKQFTVSNHYGLDTYKYLYLTCQFVCGCKSDGLDARFSSL